MRLSVTFSPAAIRLTIAIVLRIAKGPSLTFCSPNGRCFRNPTQWCPVGQLIIIVSISGKYPAQAHEPCAVISFQYVLDCSLVCRMYDTNETLHLTFMVSNFVIRFSCLCEWVSCHSNLNTGAGATN